MRHDGKIVGRIPIRILIAVAGLGLLVNAFAGAPAVPDAVRPGAIRPGEERTSQIPPTLSADVYEVPPVIDRPLDIDGGEQIVVTRFELAGVVDRPEQGISVAEVNALAERQRAERPDGFTVGRLQEVAAAVTQHYRNQGFILAQAFIPVQDVADGVVTIEVLEGKLGRVLAEGNKMYGTDLLEKPFDDLLGEPITKDQMEEVLLGLADSPGLQLFGVFQPGTQIGTADMALKVQKEKRFDFVGRYDNHGLRETGRRRGRVEGHLNNPTGAGDRLGFIAQGTTHAENQFFWRVEYERPLWQSYVWRFSFDENEFDVLGDFRDRGIASDTQNAHLSLTKNFIRSRQRNLFIGVDLAKKHARTKVRGTPRSKDNLTALMFFLDFDSVDTRFAGLNAGQIQFTHGINDVLGAMGGQGAAQNASVPPSRRGGSRNFATGEFDKLFMSFTRFQALSILSEKLRHHSLLFRSEGQWSGDRLVPLEQYAIGGP